MVAQRSAARPEQIRQHNLGLLLRHLHQQGELSRSELVEATGLNRSTIAALVAELVDRGIVTQQRAVAARSGAGRPSYLVTASGGAVYGLAVDLEVQSVTMAAIGLGGDLLARRSWTHHGQSSRPAPVVARIVQAAKDIAREVHPGVCVGVGVGVPGNVRAEDGLVLDAPNLGWRNVTFGASLQKAFDVPVRCSNDADLAALAEHQRGAAVGCHEVVCLIGRVGIGSGIVSAGLPYRGAHGYAGEVGHMTMDPTGPPCHCGRNGCLEQYAGEAAILAAAREQGLDAADISSVFAAARAGDECAVRAVDRVAEHLARGVRNLVNVLDPEMVVFTGHLADVLSCSGETVRYGMVHGAVADADHPVTIAGGVLPEPTLTGAAELAFESLLVDPRRPTP